MGRIGGRGGMKTQTDGELWLSDDPLKRKRKDIRIHTS